MYRWGVWFTPGYDGLRPGVRVSCYRARPSLNVVRLYYRLCLQLFSCLTANRLCLISGVLYNYNTIINIIIIIVLSLQYYINNENTMMIIFCVCRITSHCRAHTRLVKVVIRTDVPRVLYSPGPMFPAPYKQRAGNTGPFY